MISALHFNYIRVLSRIFSLGEKIESDGGWGAAVVGHSFLGGGGSGGIPPPPEFLLILCLLRVVLRHSETLLRS